MDLHELANAKNYKTWQCYVKPNHLLMKSATVLGLSRDITARLGTDLSTHQTRCAGNDFPDGDDVSFK